MKGWLVEMSKDDIYLSQRNEDGVGRLYLGGDVEELVQQRRERGQHGSVGVDTTCFTFEDTAIIR